MLFAVISSLCVCMRACVREYRLSELAGWHIPIPLATSSQPPSSSSFKHVWLGSFVYLAALAFIIIDHHHDELKPNDFRSDYKSTMNFRKFQECASRK